MLLLAACGKSAQFPLQSWLGDAMEGPTPVSALIHAATMVTAGVYLIVRSAPIFDGAPDAPAGRWSSSARSRCSSARSSAAPRTTSRRPSPASTMSQIGYMMLAAGLGPVGYVFAIFHLLTHGFFKAGMFLGAGSVMHGMNDEVDMRRYGGISHGHDDHLGHVRARLPGDHRRPAVLRLLEQGRDHRGGVRGLRLAAVGVRPDRAARRRHHRVLHDPPDRHDLLRRGALDRRRAPARVAADDDDADDRAGRRLGVRSA